MSQAVVFDVGGVLLDWNPRHLYRKLLSEEDSIDGFFDEVGFAAWNAAMDAGRRWEHGVADLTGQFPHRRSLIEAAHARWHEMVAGPIHDTVAILEHLDDIQTPLYAITNFSSEKWIEVRERFPFLSLFRDAVVSGDEKTIKPDPAIFRIFLARSGLRAEDCIFIDDSPANIAGAASVGMTTVRFDSPTQLRSALCEQGITG